MGFSRVHANPNGTLRDSREICRFIRRLLGGPETTNYAHCFGVEGYIGVMENKDGNYHLRVSGLGIACELLKPVL